MSLERKFQRAQQKRDYERFSKAWRAEQRYQAVVLAKGEKLPENTPKLRRKPTFKMWLNITRTVKAQQTAQPIEVQEFVDDTSLDWDEEGTESPGDQPSEQQPTEVQK